VPVDTLAEAVVVQRVLVDTLVEGLSELAMEHSILGDILRKEEHNDI
jgi:hypothetical protein